MRLLVAFDGSDGARAALREATVLARECGAIVLLVQVLNPRLDAVDVAASTMEAAMAVVTERTRSALDLVLGEINLAGATGEVVELRRGEDVAEAIERIAAERDASMVVISTRRAASLAGLILGSITQHVLWNAPCPVLVVRA